MVKELKNLYEYQGADALYPMCIGSKAREHVSSFFLCRNTVNHLTSPKLLIRHIEYAISKLSQTVPSPLEEAAMIVVPVEQKCENFSKFP